MARQMFEGGCGGRVEGDDVGERRGQAGVVGEGVPGGEGEAADAAALAPVRGAARGRSPRGRRSLAARDLRSVRPRRCLSRLEPRGSGPRRRAPARGSPTDSRPAADEFRGSGLAAGARRRGLGVISVSAAGVPPARRSRRSARRAAAGARRIRRGSIGAVVAVDLEADGGVDRFAGLGREGAAVAEADAAGAGAAGGEGERDVAALPHRAWVGEVGGGDEQGDCRGCPCRRA